MATTSTSLRGRRPTDLQQLEQRRRHAARLFRSGASQAEVARRLGVSAQTGSRWHARWAQGGVRALRASRRAGRPAQLTGRQLAQLRQVLLDGALAAGFDNELWTLSRIQTVVWQRFGVGFTPQRPARRAVERDEDRIARWVAEEWPAIKQTPVPTTRGCVSKTSPGSA
jgi:transposase